MDRLNIKKSTENNSAKNNIYGTIRKNEHRPSFAMIPEEKIGAKTLNEKMDIYLKNQYSLNKSIQAFMDKQDKYMKKQGEYMAKLDKYMDNQKYIYKALILNLQQLSGDMKGLKKNI